MLNNGFLKNMKLFKLVEYGHSYSKIIKLVKRLGDNVVDENNIILILGNTPKTIAIINDLNVALNSEHYSMWCLLYYGVNSSIIERLKKEFEDINIMAARINDLPILGFHESTINKIIIALDNLGLKQNEKLENDVIKIIENNEPITNIELKTIIFNKYYDVDSRVLDSLIDSMLDRKIITNTLSGYKLRHFSLKEYLNESAKEVDSIILDRCYGKTLEEIGKELNITKERVRQKINKRISELPIFNYEKEYYQIRNEYNLSKKDISILGFDALTWNYIYLKYEDMNPKKNAIDYLKEHNLCDSDKGRAVFKEYKLLIIDNEIVEDDFIKLFIRFINKQNYNSFNVVGIADNFNCYLTKNNIANENYYIGKDNVMIICRKLENSNKFLNAGRKNFIYFEEDSLSSDFIRTMKENLLNFEGYGSTLLFYNQNKKLCNDNQINNENELFTVMKRMFSKEFENSIEFIRNPTLAKKGINREIYIENLLLDLDLPCTVDDYLNYIFSVTGLKQESVAANFGEMINKYKNADGLISLDNEYTDEEKIKFINLLDNRKCIGAKLFDFQVKSIFKENANTFLNSNTIRKFGYIKTNTSIYKNIYQNRLESVEDTLKDQKIILTENEIAKFANIEFFIQKQYDALKCCLVVKIDDNKYLNIVARNEQDYIKQLKQDLFNLLENDEIYILNNFLNSATFEKLLELKNEYNNILYSFDMKEIIKFILSTTEGINYLSQGDTFLFSKSVISYETIIYRIMHEYESLSIGEFREIMYDIYGITKTFSNAELSDMGYYCPYTSEKIYLNEKYYEYEMEEYLNGNY